MDQPLRHPPKNIEAEREVLGAMLLDNRAIDDVAPLLRPEHFYQEEHRTVYEIALDLYGQGKPADAVMVGDVLEKRPGFTSLSATMLLGDIMEATPHALNARYHAALVRDKAIKREIIDAASRMLRGAYADDAPAGDILNEAEREVYALAEAECIGDSAALGDIMAEVWERVQNRQDGPRGILTGYNHLDALLGGLEGGQLLILAGRASMGKTAFGLSLTRNIAGAGKSVLFVSLEMGKLDLAERLVSAESGVGGNRVRTGQGLNAEDLRALGRGFSVLGKLPVTIDDTPVRSMLQIAANARRLKRRGGLDLVMVDYLQLIEPVSRRDSRQEQIAQISRGLKAMARDLGVPVVALSQLNREVEKREDRKPRLSDLRESGAIEQDADMVLMVHRPEYYDANDRPGEADIIVAKNRSGPTGYVPLLYVRHLMRFEPKEGAEVAELPSDDLAF